MSYFRRHSYKPGLYKAWLGESQVSTELHWSDHIRWSLLKLIRSHHISWWSLNWSDHISWCSIYENRRWSVVSLHQILKRPSSLLPPFVSNPEKSNPEIKKSNPEKVLFPPPIQAIHSLYRYPHTFSYLPGWDQISFWWNIDQNY